MATKELNPTHNQTDMNFNLDLSDYECILPQPSARECAEIRKRIGEVLREEELNMYPKKQKTNANTDTDINMWPKYIIIESRNSEGDTFSKLTPFCSFKICRTSNWKRDISEKIQIR